MAGSRPANRGNRSSNRVGSLTSRRLKAAGFNVSPSSRRHRFNGLFVSGIDKTASILLDLGTASANERNHDRLVRELMTWDHIADAGIDWEWLPGEDRAVLIWVQFK